MFGLGPGEMLMIALLVVGGGALVVTVIRLALRPLEAKVDRIVAMLESRGAKSGA